MQMKQLGIVIVTHNSEAVISGCLASLPVELAGTVVVDNASTDGTTAAVLSFPEAKLLANPWNRGFAAAVNQAIEAVECRYVLLLNPDARVLGGLEDLMEACKLPGVAAAGGRLVDEDGRTQTGFMVRRLPTAAALALEILGVNRLWPGNPINRRFRYAELDPDLPAEVEQPAGAFLLIRREAWRELGGLDEQFEPLWFEDVDFCRRLLDRGHRVLYLPGAVASHVGGHSATQLPLGEREVFWYGNLLRYAAKHFRSAALAAVCMTLILGSCLRTVMGILRERSLKPVQIYGKVIGLAGRILFRGPGSGLRLSSAFGTVGRHGIR